MPVEERYGRYIPEVGDVVLYSRVGKPLTVTRTERMGGYTDIWLGEQLGDFSATFNINHSTGAANTSHYGGRWELISRADDPKPTQREVYTETEEDIAARLFEWLVENYGSAQLGFFGATRVVKRTIEVIREEVIEE